jgi:hypothetical protein
MTESSGAPSGGLGAPGGSAEGAQPYTYRPGPYPPALQLYSGFPPPPTAPKNGLGVASLVVAIVALLVSVSIVGGVILGVAALIIGLAARARARRGEASNGGVAITGIVLSIVAIVISMMIFVALAALVFGTDLFNEDYQHCIGYHPGDEQFCDQYR